ncbi:ribonuclease E inhibitor RraB [Parasalinivibrio latis]|uniref:ribonuclease E inhibitor RraB n=1 Tax=Parasalinivibrio latis TaxID=2952610 RepID=UPI0030DE68F9
MSAELIEEQKQETREIIASLLEDGSEPDALYTIEHHLAGENFEALEAVAVQAFKLGYEIFEAEEAELEDGTKVFCCDAIMESALDADRIDAQVAQLVELADKHGLYYDGWGTYFESGEDDEEEEGDEE